jgi:hypothetical protein
MAGQAWCECGKDPRAIYTIPGKPERVCPACWEKWLITNERGNEISRKRPYKPMDDKLFENIRRKDRNK